MTVSNESVNAYRDLLTNPKKYGLCMAPLSELFELSTASIPKHLIYDQYLLKVDKTRDQLPKLYFYIVMDELYTVKKSENGDLGYCVRFKT